MALRDSQQKSASILYRFLLGSEHHNGIFRKPKTTRSLCIDAWSWGIVRDSRLAIIFAFMIGQKHCEHSAL